MSNIGKVIKGFCNGYFGRDDYEDKVIVYETDTAICCKYLDNDNLTVANFKSEEEKNQYIEKWMSEDFYILLPQNELHRNRNRMNERDIKR